MKKPKILLSIIILLAVLLSAGYFGYTQYDLKNAKKSLSDYADTYNKNKKNYFVEEADEKKVMTAVNSALNGKDKNACTLALNELKNYESSLKFNNSTKLINKLNSINLSSIADADKNKLLTIKKEVQELINKSNFKTASAKIDEIEALVETSKKNTLDLCQ